MLWLSWFEVAGGLGIAGARVCGLHKFHRAGTHGQIR